MKNFNLIIAGFGGQGLITLLKITAEAALVEGYDLKTSELHGLAQRGGSVEVHLRFGRKIFSPLVLPGQADLIIGLELQECLKAAYFASPQTTFLINKHLIPLPLKKSFSEDQILKILKRITQKIKIIPANQILEEKLGTGVVAGVYLISLAIDQRLLPLKSTSILKAIKKVVPQQYLDLNQKAFQLARKYYQ